MGCPGGRDRRAHGSGPGGVVDIVKYATTIELRGGDAEIVVEYTAHKGQSSGLHGPAEPAWIEIDAVTYGGCTITDALRESQIEALQQEIEDDITAAEEAAMERHDEQMREYRAEYLQEMKRDLADPRNIEYWEARE